MRAKSEKPVPDELAAEVRPIEVVTENGFSILRAWEVHGTSPPTARSFQFIVRDPQGTFHDVVVETVDSVLEALSLQIRLQILGCSSFWICCAERQLANFLGEMGACPPDNKLLVQCLDPEEVILATRWSRKTAREQGFYW